MELSKFLDKHHSRHEKIRILEKMLKAATSSKHQATSVIISPQRSDTI